MSGRPFSRKKSGKVFFVSFIFLSKKKNSRRKIFSWLDQTYFEMFRENFKRKLVFWKFFLTAFSQWFKTFFAFFQKNFSVLIKTALYMSSGTFLKVWKCVFFQFWAKRVANFGEGSWRTFQRCFLTVQESFFYKKCFFRNFRTFLSPSDFEVNILSLLAEIRR